MCIVALADDMTGALEIGAQFRGAGFHCLVSAKPIAVQSAAVVVFDTETRHCSPEAAAREVRRFVLESGATHPRLIYKKTDSTLRGNISAELRALADLFPGTRIGYAPAYPALGRTVKDGMLYVDGVLVAESTFAGDILNPIRSSSVASILEPQLPCTVFDGVTDTDLAESARNILGDDRMRIAAGPAGLAGMIARQIGGPLAAASGLPRVRRCLVINGSLHQHSAAQMELAEKQGCISRADTAAWRMLQKTYPSGASPAEVASENGKYVAEQIDATAPDGVLVIGGDTAFAVISALGLPTLTPLSEVVPGAPISRIESTGHGETRDLLLITKAGGFGAIDAICRLRALLDTGAT